MALMSAVAPDGKFNAMANVSPLANDVANVLSLAYTELAGPSKEMAKSTKWMPVADKGPQGANSFDSRQLSGARVKNLF